MSGRVSRGEGGVRRLPRGEHQTVLRLQTAKNVLSYPNRHILSQNPHSHHTPQSGYHGVAEVAKTANIAKMAEKCINCISAGPTLPHTNPMESGPKNTFSAQNRKKPKDS